MNNDLISRSALIKWIDDSVSQFGGTYSADMMNMWGLFKDYLINNVRPVEVPENAVNCVLTMCGECSYNKTGCSDCEIIQKIGKALEQMDCCPVYSDNEVKQPCLQSPCIVPKKGKWINKVDDVGFVSYVCSECGFELELEECSDSYYCPNCGADMREADNE